MPATEASVAQGISRADLDRLKPLNGFYLLKRDPEPERAGKILLLAKGEDKRRRFLSSAVVIRVGEPERNPKSKTGAFIPMSLKAGDRVIIDRFAGHDIEVNEDGARYVLVAEQDLKMEIGGDVRFTAR